MNTTTYYLIRINDSTQKYHIRGRKVSKIFLLRHEGEAQHALCCDVCSLAEQRNFGGHRRLSNLQNKYALNFVETQHKAHKQQFKHNIFNSLLNERMCLYAGAYLFFRLRISCWAVRNEQQCVKWTFCLTVKHQSIFFIYIFLSSPPSPFLGQHFSCSKANRICANRHGDPESAL